MCMGVCVSMSVCVCMCVCVYAYACEWVSVYVCLFRRPDHVICHHASPLGDGAGYGAGDRAGDGAGDGGGFSVLSKYLRPPVRRTHLCCWGDESDEVED